MASNSQIYNKKTLTSTEYPARNCFHVLTHSIQAVYISVKSTDGVRHTGHLTAAWAVVSMQRGRILPQRREWRQSALADQFSYTPVIHFPQTILCLLLGIHGLHCW